MGALRRPALLAAALVSAVVAVLGFTVATVVAADRRADEAGLVAEQVADLEKVALELGQIQLRAASEGTAIPPETLREGLGLIAELRSRMGRLRAVRSREQLVPLHELLSPYVHSATAHLGLLDRGDIAGARDVELTRVRPAYEALTLGVAAVEAREQRARDRADEQTLGYTVGAVLGGFVMFLVLGLAGMRSHRRAERAFARQAEADRDPLTGLASRRRLEAAVDRGIGLGRGLCLTVVDLDGFKSVNDLYGHARGDDLLRIVGARLAASAPAGALVARLGSDEFAVLASGAPAADWLTAGSSHLARTLGEPVAFGSRPVVLRASAGIAALAAGERVERDEFLHRADLAMYAAKDAGGDRLIPYEDGMREAVLRRTVLADELDRGIRQGELRLHVQPIMDLRTERAVGMEALVRWEHPERGLVPPFEFIPLAEQTGLVVPLGVWVLREACRIAASWVDALGDDAPYVSVNLAAAQLECPSIVEDVRAALDDAGLAPGKLLLELTESALIADLEASAGRLERLRDLGVRLAVDDFGTGYSSLDYLRRFEMDVLKIDRRFIGGVHRGDAALVRAMIAMGRGLDLRTVAEGVEEQEQASALRALGCGLAQGFLWSRPVPAADGLSTIGRLSAVAPAIVATVALPRTLTRRRVSR